MSSIGGSAHKRTTGRKLQRLNARLAQAQPFCVQCLKQGRHRIGTVTDHVVALCNGGIDTPGNTQRLCERCHRSKTADDTGSRKRLAIGVDGWPLADGQV